MHQGTADQGMLGAQGKGAYGFVCSCKVQETGESVAVKKVAPPAPKLLLPPPSPSCRLAPRQRRQMARRHRQRAPAACT